MTIQYVRHRRGASSRLAFSIDEKDVARVRRKLERASGMSLYKRMQRGTLAAGDIVAGKVRQASPRKSGTLRKSVKVRAARRRGFGAKGRSLTVLVGPMAPHRHLVIRGHRMVTPGGRYLGWRTRANPYVDRAAKGIERKAAQLVQKEWRALLR